MSSIQLLSLKHMKIRLSAHLKPILSTEHQKDNLSKMCKNAAEKYEKEDEGLEASGM